MTVAATDHAQPPAHSPGILNRRILHLGHTDMARILIVLEAPPTGAHLDCRLHFDIRVGPVRATDRGSRNVVSKDHTVGSAHQIAELADGIAESLGWPV